jgi:protein-disulfide isomerase-like protein with CxxC motif
MNTANALIVTQLSLQLATQLQQLLAIRAQAAAEGRDITDEEVARSSASAQGVLDQLQALIDSKKG